MTELININIYPTTEHQLVKGCRYIYSPGGAAFEYAQLAANPYNGCGHFCLYCYVPLAMHANAERKAEFHARAVPKANYPSHLTADAKKYQAEGITEQVLFCFSTDAYNPFDTSLTRPSLEIVQKHGMAICVLTKGGSRALADIDLYRPERDCFASTLTSLDDAFSKKWERAAALPGDRMATLKAFHDRGIFTWVSLEPTLSVEASLEIVRTTHDFVDLFKVGKANYLGEYSKGIDWQDYTLRMIDLCAKLEVKHYIKRDLQPYLPARYHNPLRVPQYHPQSEATRARGR
jgi:DNA repair photolyase